MKVNEIIAAVGNGTLKVNGLKEKVSSRDLYGSEDAFAYCDAESPYGIDIQIIGYAYDYGEADENGEPINLYPEPTRWACFINFNPERVVAVHETPGKALAAALTELRDSDIKEFGEEYFFRAIRRTRFRSYGYGC